MYNLASNEKIKQNHEKINDLFLQLRESLFPQITRLIQSYLVHCCADCLYTKLVLSKNKQWRRTFDFTFSLDLKTIQGQPLHDSIVKYFSEYGYSNSIPKSINIDVLHDTGGRDDGKPFGVLGIYYNVAFNIRRCHEFYYPATKYTLCDFVKNIVHHQSFRVEKPWNLPQISWVPDFVLKIIYLHCHYTF
jgi:hypothetical protein